MEPLNLGKSSGEAGEDVYGWLKVTIAYLCITWIPSKFWMNAASSELTEAANNWFTAWASDTVVNLNRDAFCHA